MLFMYLKHVITAGILSAALAMGPGAAFAQTSGSSSGTSGTSSQGSSSQGSSTTGTSSQGSSTTGSPSATTTSSSASSAPRQAGSGGSGADQEAVRQHLSAAREALAELTKLPAASQLQGEQRQQVAQLISDFNAFATATTDWRPKYDTIDRELDQILGLDASGTSGASTGTASGAGTSGSAGAATGTTADASGTAAGTASDAVGTSGSGAAGSLDPTIIAKLKEVRTHLDGFEEASGDPTFVVEKIEKILDQAAGGASASGAVGTAGASDSASAAGSVTLTSAQVQELRRQLDMIKAAAKR
jgi:hypothetical protein